MDGSTTHVVSHLAGTFLVPRRVLHLSVALLHRLQMLHRQLEDVGFVHLCTARLLERSRGEYHNTAAMVTICVMREIGVYCSN